MSEIMNNGMNEIGSNGIKGNGTEEKKYRIEHDSIGEKEVPIDAYYGVQTLRAHENFYITGLKMHPELIKSVAQIKKAAAITNFEVGELDKKRASAITTRDWSARHRCFRRKRQLRRVSSWYMPTQAR